MYSDPEQNGEALLYAMPPSILVAMAILLCLAGIYLIWSSWQASKANWIKITLGWSLVLAATPAWVLLSGPEFGITFQLICLSLLAWLLTLLKAENKPLKPLPVNTASQGAAVNKWRVTGQVLAIAILCGISSVALVIEVASLLPIPRPAQLVLGSLTFPVVWSIFAIILCYSPYLWRICGLLLGLSLLSAWHLFG